jgi:hypothetical protein
VVTFLKMKNKTNIKPKTRNAGTFTTVSLKLLNNNNLSRDARFLLIQIFSDSDEFTFSPTLYADRMGCTEKHIHNKVVELENHGFAKRTPLSKDSYVKGRKKKGSDKIIYHYTFSEFGNLNKSDEYPTKQVKSEVKLPIKPTKESLQQLAEWVENDYFAYTANELIDWIGIESFESDNDQFIALVERLANKVPHIQKLYIDEVKDSLKDYHSKKYPNSVKKKMDDKIKQTVFDEQRIFNPPSIAGALNEAQGYWDRLTNEYNKKQNDKNLDYETRLHDQLEEAYYDGDY